MVASIDRAKTARLVSSSEAQTLRVFTLGRFEVVQGDRVILNEQWRSGKARSLFKVMLARRNYQISRQEAEDLLWPELDQVRAANNLNQAVYNLRRTLEPTLERADASIYLKTDGSRLLLNAEMLSWIDLEEFESFYQQALASHDLRLYEQTCNLYTGHYLPEDLNEDWSVGRRETLRHQVMTMLARMAGLYEAENQLEKYRQCLYRVLEYDFSHEESVQKLMRSLAECGRRDEALSFYRKFTLKLKNQLDMEPLPETRQLYQTIASGKLATTVIPTKAAAVTPAPAILPAANLQKANPQTNPKNIKIRPSRLETKDFPSQLKSNTAKAACLSGREAELLRWKAILENGLSGKGGFALMQGEAGSGKTVLAEAMAQQAKQAGYLVLQVACQSAQTLSSFGAIGQLLEQALRAFSGEELEECLRRCNASLFNLLPQFSLPTANNNSSGEIEPEALAIAANLILGRANQKWPLILIIDNLHYMSMQELRLLQGLLTQANLSKLVVLATCRPVAVAQVSPELRHLLNWAGENPQTIFRLGRLSNASLAQLLENAFSDFSLSSSAIAMLEKYSQGNPRLALELAFHWRDNNQLYLEDEQWQLTLADTSEAISDTICNYIQSLLENVSEEAHTLLSLATLIGPTFSFEVLRRIVWQRSDGAGWWINLDKTKLGRVLVELTDVGFLAEQNLAYRFAYPLLAEVLQASMPNIQRKCWQEVIDWVQEGRNNYD